MKTFSLFLFAMVSLAPTARASASLREAFFAHAEVRKVEEKIALLPLSEKAEWEKEKQKQKLEAALTEARIHFHSFQLANSPDLSPAEAMLLNRKQGKILPGKALKLSDRFLEENFSDAENFSLLEWELLEEWFGKDLAKAHLQLKFPAQSMLKSRKLSNENVEKINIIYIEDPFEKKRNLSKQQKLVDTTEVLQLSQFPDLEQQAEELKIRLENFQEPFMVVTKGRSSATFQKLLDIKPQLRVDPRIRGWINWDGTLSGKKLPAKKSTRGLASTQNQPALNPLELKAQKALYLLRKEDLERQPGLGKGFPIVNLLSAESYPKRESIVSEGQVVTFSAKENPPFEEVLSMLENP